MVWPTAAQAALVPASDSPLGYSLADLAEDTAVYLTSLSNGSLNPPPPPNVPFNLFGTPLQQNVIGPDTYTYASIIYDDNSPPADPNFPTDLTNQQADAQYLDNVLAGYGYYGADINIDGHNYPLSDDYTVGVNTPPLDDGGGTEFIVAAAVIPPLSPGEHTISVGEFVGDGTTVTFFTSSTLTVTAPEPATLGMVVVIASLAPLRRRR